MIIKDTLRPTSAFFSPYGMPKRFGMAMPMPVFAPEGGPSGDGSNDDPEPKEPKEKKTPDASSGDAEKAAREAARAKKALEMANQNLADLQGQLKRFDGIDPEQVRSLLADAAKVEEERKKAEEQRLRDAGDFEALKGRILKEHQKELESERNRTSETQKQIDQLNRQIHELTIGAAFASSSFIKDETLLPPRQARRSFEEYFEIKDGVIVAYDRPASENGRVPLVDSRGRNLPFDEAIKQIIEGDPDRDRLLRATQRPGSGAAPSRGRVEDRSNEKAPTGVAAIAAALSKRNK